MNENVKANLIELLQLLSDHDAEQEDIDDMLPALELALSDPKAFLEEYPEDQWIADTHGPEPIPMKLSEDLFAWTFSGVMEEFSVIGDKGDEIAEGIIDVLLDKDFEVTLTDDAGNWFEFAADIDRQLVAQKANVKAIALDINFSDDMSVFLFPRDQEARVLELIRFFNMKLVA